MDGVMVQVKDITTERVMREIVASGTVAAYAALSSRFPPKVVARKWARLVDKGLLDYGVSLRAAFLTPAGIAWCRERGIVPGDGEGR